MERRCRESDQRSRDRRASVVRARPRRLRSGLIALALAGFITTTAIAVPGGGASVGQGFARAGETPPVFAAFEFTSRARMEAARRFTFEPPPVPARPAIRAAIRYATQRVGLVSFAAIDSEGRLRSHDADRQYAAASVVKAMVLAAELGRLDRANLPVDSNTDALLTAMVTQSDNAATDVIYRRVGDFGLHTVAERAGMEGFEIAGYWGNAQITAADMARFFGDLDRMLGERHREYGQSLLGSVIASQSWGIPEAAGSEWAPRFKGGWLPDHALVHQAAELRERGGPREISLVVLTDEQPSFEYGIETVRGVAQRLLAAR